MATAAEVLGAYREQAGLDADEAITLLVEFLGSYGMTGGATDALCNYLDEEGMAEDFAGVLIENGLVIETGEVPEDDGDAE